MIRSYLKVAIRNILKHKAYSFVNIFGLAGSLAITILIIFYAISVLTFDQFHDDSDRIYFMYRDRATEDGRLDVFDTWYPLAEASVEEFPMVESGTRMVTVGNTWVELEDKRFEHELTYADSNFFEVFSWPLLAGDRETLLDDPSSVVITKEIAEKFFNDEDPIGKTLTFGFSTPRIVAGVLGEIPSNSSYTFECIAPLNDALVTRWLGDNHWRGSFCDTFIKLKEGVNPDELRPQLGILMDKYVGEAEQGNFLILPISDLYDKITGRQKYASILLWVAVGILIIAVINFTNLSTAQNLLRIKEVGVRKVLGSGKQSLMGQFIGESVMLAMIALIAGGLLSELLINDFSEMVGMKLQTNYLERPFLLAIIPGLSLLMGLVSGFYPAFYISRLNAGRILKGENSRSGNMTFRNSLVVVQFVLAIGLISGVGIIMKQINFMKDHELNFDQENVMVIPLSLRDFRDPGTSLPRIVSFRNELKGITGVSNVTGSSSVPGNYRRSFSLFLAEGKMDVTLDWQVAVIDHEFFETYGVRMIDGRSFNQGSASDFDQGVILNQAALDVIGWEQTEGVGKKLYFPTSREELNIIGVVEDFNVQSLKDPVQPLVHYYGGDSARSYQYVSVKINPESREQVISEVQRTWEKMDFGQELEYYFPNERFSELYETEENVARVLTSSMIFAIIIACLGLYALSSFSVGLKLKEIAIRKVMGASISTIMASFSKKYVVLVAIAAIPAIPLSIYAMDLWLRDFAYRISIGPEVYIITVLLVTLLALFTISFHALKAGRTNPVEYLREQ